MSRNLPRTVGGKKGDAYIKSGRWKITSARNTVPMLLIPKPGTKPPELQTVVDLQECNKNTRKLMSPLPDMNGILWWTTSKPFRTVLDLKNAYEQIIIVPEHVEQSAITTPDSNMVSQVIQIGDCNAPAMHQALMNHLTLGNSWLSIWTTLWFIPTAWKTTCAQCLMQRKTIP